MVSHNALAEFRSHWLPHTTDEGLSRIIELLETDSPLLIHGAFSRACAMGCLATHIAWHHPVTTHWNDEAGVIWLIKVAGLNPATSAVIQDWDRDWVGIREFRAELLKVCQTEMQERSHRNIQCNPVARPRRSDILI
jgi:hypothetical protein